MTSRESAGQDSAAPAPESARDRLRKAIEGELCLCGDYYCPTADQILDDVLAEHAHELAEKIRAEADSDPIVPVYAGKRGPVGNSLRWAADLIDPEVTP